MKRHLQYFSVKVLICLFLGGTALYAHINKNNKLTAIQLLIPQVEKEVKNIRKENERLQYEIDTFESPIHLMELLRKPEFSHLKFPRHHDVMLLQQKRNIPEEKKA